MMRNDLNMISNIKIKLLRAGMFNLDNLSKIPLGQSFVLKSVNIGVDRVLVILSKVANSDRIVEFKQIAAAWANYILSHYYQYRQYLTPDEDLFIRSRAGSGDPLFVTLESYALGEYVIRV